jgi:hypothetical protein
MAQAGVSTLGIVFSYGIETTAGEKPTSFKKLDRINSIGGISIEPETIDASALEDTVERSVAGRGTTAGSFPVVVNLTDLTFAQWEKLIEEYNEMESGIRMWFQVSAPGLTNAFYVAAQPPQEIPMPDMSQNELLTVEIPLTIDKYEGMSAKVKETENEIAA